MSLTTENFSDLKVTTDTRKLRQIIRHVTSKCLQNAKKTGTSVLIETHLKGSDLKITIEDDAECHNADVESLFNGSPSTSRGNEMGLWIAQTFSELLGGKIEGISDPSGMRFVVTLSVQDLKAESVKKKNSLPPETNKQTTEKVYF